jgi:hypothetical protein
MRKLKKGIILLLLGFSLSGWISKQYLRVFEGPDFEDQLEIYQIPALEYQYFMTN